MSSHLAPQETDLLSVLSALYPASSKSTLRAWIGEGRIAIDGKIVNSAKHLVLKGQQLVVGKKERRLEHEVPIIYSDKDVIVIDKPVGLLSVATAFEKEKTAHALLKRKYYPRPVYVVHRLDQETSGTMVFALTVGGLGKLKKIFEKHDLERRYVAIIEGQMESSSGTWESYLYEDANYHVRVVNSKEKGELAITHYSVQATSKQFSWLELILETGKKNQIRVHCQHAGHPVIGDKKYGSTCNPIKRLGLHAHVLAFAHPITGKPMRFVSPLPDSFQRLFK